MLTLLKAGLYTTVQDNGRFLGAHLGIPSSGAMDRQSAEIANLILGNNKNDALLECTFIGPSIEFHAPTLISIVGAEIPAFLNDIKLNPSKNIQIDNGDILTFGKIEKGSRFYIGVKGGILSEVVYNSRSTCITGGILKQLKNGDQLPYLPYSATKTSSVSIKRVLGNNILNVFKGPEFSILSSDLQKSLIGSSYTILPDSNRMAFRVKHPLELSHSHSIISSATMPGTVQLTTSGELIILMRDTQTTGGYPRILQLSEEAINDLSQLMPSEEFTLKLDD